METKKIPQYQSKAQVSALQISKVVPNDLNGGAVLHFKEEGFDPITVNNRFVQQYKPTEGSFVIFGDGSRECKSEEVFNQEYEGYTEFTVDKEDVNPEDLKDREDVLENGSGNPDPNPDGGAGGGVDVNINAHSKDLSAEDAIDAIEKIETEEKLTAFILDDERPTILEAVEIAKAKFTEGGGS